MIHAARTHQASVGSSSTNRNWPISRKYLCPRQPFFRHALQGFVHTLIPRELINFHPGERVTFGADIKKLARGVDDKTHVPMDMGRFVCTRGNFVCVKVKNFWDDAVRTQTIQARFLLR